MEDSSEFARELIAVIATDRGDIRVRLFSEDAPLTVVNFVNLAQRGYFDGLTFHRVIENFMIQGGDPTGTGRGGPGYQFKNEISRKHRHDAPGVVSMANSGPGTNGSQFFVTHVETPWLNDKHSVFGKVIAGQDVVNVVRQGDAMRRVTVEGDCAALLETHKKQLETWNKTLDQLYPSRRLVSRSSGT